MHCRLLAVVVATTAMVAVLAAPGQVPPSAAAPPGPLDAAGIPVFPGLTRHVLDLRLADGLPAVANVLSFAGDDPHLQLRPVLARDRIPGLETVPSMGKRVLVDGGVAGVNGGFWLHAPVGEPNGYLAMDGRLVSEPQTQGAGPRGTYALRADGRLLMDRLEGVLELHAGLADPLRVTAVNRYHSSAAPYPDNDAGIYVYTPVFGSTATIRPLLADDGPHPVRILTVQGLRLSAGTGAANGLVTSVATGGGEVPIPADGALLVAHGDSADDLAMVHAGQTVQVRVLLQPSSTDAAEWSRITSGLAVGPLLVAEGRRTDPRGWEDEGFDPSVHSARRHPRSALAQLGDGRVLLVTVDGRQPGYSHGMTIAEVTDFLLDLGAVRALSLDGGGSSQLVVDGLLRNRACCDTPLRPVADGLFVFHDYAFTATERIAGANREATAAAAAVTTYPTVKEVLLASAASFPDALAGGPLATAQESALLLAGRTSLSANTLAALRRLRPQRVTLLGGPAVLSEELRSSLQQAGYQVGRISGRDRTETAAAIADALGPVHPRVFLAAAGGFADALSAAAPAGLLSSPILLTARDELSAATREALMASNTREVVIVGGAAAVSRDVEAQVQLLGIDTTRLSGTSRYATARQVNTWAEQELDGGLDAQGLVVALGTTFPDALAGGPFAAARRQLLLIVPPGEVEADPDTGAYLRTRDAAGLVRVTLLGGHAALSSYQQWQLDQLAR